MDPRVHFTDLEKDLSMVICSGCGTAMVPLSGWARSLRLTQRCSACLKAEVLAKIYYGIRDPRYCLARHAVHGSCLKIAGHEGDHDSLKGTWSHDETS